MAALLTTATANTVGTGASHTGPCTVWVSGTMDGARVVIQGSATDGSYTPLSNGLMTPSRFDGGVGAAAIDGQGTYYLRAVLENAGSSTSVTVTTTQ